VRILRAAVENSILDIITTTGVCFGRHTTTVLDVLVFVSLFAAFASEGFAPKMVCVFFVFPLPTSGRTANGEPVLSFKCVWLLRILIH
jgi:hypothetical protein